MLLCHLKWNMWYKFKVRFSHNVQLLSECFVVINATWPISSTVDGGILGTFKHVSNCIAIHHITLIPAKCPCTASSYMFFSLQSSYISQKLYATIMHLLFCCWFLITSSAIHCICKQHWAVYVPIIGPVFGAMQSQMNCACPPKQDWRFASRAAQFFKDEVEIQVTSFSWKCSAI